MYFVLFQLAVQGNYCLSQLCIKRGNVEFLKSLASTSVTVSVEGTDFSVDFMPVCRKCSSLTCAVNQGTSDSFSFTL